METQTWRYICSNLITTFTKICKEGGKSGCFCVETMSFFAWCLGSLEQVVCTCLSHTVVQEKPFLTIIPGRHCCLWCLIIQDQLKLPPSIRGPVTLRTTQSTLDDNNRFKRAGGNIKTSITAYTGHLSLLYQTHKLAEHVFSIIRPQNVIYIAIPSYLYVRCVLQDCTSHLEYSCVYFFF